MHAKHFSCKDILPVLDTKVGDKVILDLTYYSVRNKDVNISPCFTATHTW